MTKLVKTNNTFPFFNDIFDDFFTSTNSRRASASSLKTDILESDEGYELRVDVPGFGKDDIKITLDKGYLTIEAKKDEVKEEETKHYVRRERFTGTCARSFYVGDDIQEEDIKAKYEKGILNLFIPKEGTNKKETKYISID
ncbi:MAG: Hsp20/alpha crystallin family protein [Bacilli bacterium]|nr:Hsp20/alpha crystallin family protein [Bacilli bacterium]MBN2877222.1 Hsp20/alpha crystallin family protein [Bacilli bacterium]